MPLDLSIRPATVDDTSAVVLLWQRCDLIVPHNPPEKDFRRAVTGPSSDVLVAVQNSAIVGSAMVGDDGHRGWIYYLAVDPDVQRKGIGERLCTAAEAWAKARGLSKIQLMIRPSNEKVRQFYITAAYEETPRLVMAKWLGKESGRNVETPEIPE